MGGDHLWDALGALGETLGALAVFITLAYLARQVRAQNKASQISSFDRAMEGFNELNILLGSQKELFRIYITGLNRPEDLSDDEAARFSLLFRAYLNINATAFRAYERGAIDAETWADLAAQAQEQLDSPGGRLFRAGNRRGIPDFYESLEAHRREESTLDLSLGRTGLPRADRCEHES